MSSNNVVEITSKYLKVRGGQQTVWDRYYSCWQYEMPDGKVLCPPMLAETFDLFREHVIEVMRGEGARPNIVTRSDGKEVFQWTNIVPIRLGVVIEDDCWTLAAIEAATLVLEGEQDAER